MSYEIRHSATSQTLTRPTFLGACKYLVQFAETHHKTEVFEIWEVDRRKRTPRYEKVAEFECSD